MRLHRRTDHARDETKVRREPVVESVYDVAQKASRAALVPRLGALARDTGQCFGVGGRLFRELERDFLRIGKRRGVVKIEIALHFLAFFSEQERQQESRTEPSSKPGPDLRVQRRPREANFVTVLGQQLAPDLNVPLFDSGQLDIDVLLLGITLLTSQREIQVGGVCFVLPMMEPFVNVRFWHAPRYPGNLKFLLGKYLRASCVVRRA